MLFGWFWELREHRSEPGLVDVEEPIGRFPLAERLEEFLGAV